MGKAKMRDVRARVSTGCWPSAEREVWASRRRPLLRRWGWVTRA